MASILPILFIIALVIVIICLIVNVAFILSLPDCGGNSGISCNFKKGTLWTNAAILIAIVIVILIYWLAVRVRRTALYQCAGSAAASPYGGTSTGAILAGPAIESAVTSNASEV